MADRPVVTQWRIHTFQTDDLARVLRLLFEESAPAAGDA